MNPSPSNLHGHNIEVRNVLASCQRPNLSDIERQRTHRATERYFSRPRPPPLSNAERQRRYRERRMARNMRSPNHLQVTNTTPLQEIAEHSDQNQGHIRSPSRDIRTTQEWTRADLYFTKSFKLNSFGHVCDVCDRIWFEKDLTKVQSSHLEILEREFGVDCRAFMLCANCKRILSTNKIPPNSITNGFKYPQKPVGLPPLDPISARLISPRIPFMAIRRLRRDGGYGIIGQVINVPVDVDTMSRLLPRGIDDDYAFNVSIKRRLIHKSSYLTGFVKKSVIKSWLIYLVQQPLYRHYNITVDPEFLSGPDEVLNTIEHRSSNVNGERMDEDNQNLDDIVEHFDSNENENESLLARQHSLLWNEDNVLHIAPAQGRRPLNILFDHHAEELSFPQIYYGVGRLFNLNVHVTPYMIANSEIRRRDRRGATPEHVLYMAMKILRIRVVDSIRSSFRCVRETENISRRMIQDPKFLEECVEKNFAFLKSIPNSINYWIARKKDLFAMMRQLGKPTAFLTMSANEMNWPDLVNILSRLADNRNSDQAPTFDSLDRSSRARLINEDPVTCCLYFNKLLDTLLNMIRAKKRYNPFGRYRVRDFFLRIEFQHRGSPHAHILLWLDNDPCESVSESMPLTLQLITDLCSAARDDLPTQSYANQVHRHTFTCTKRGEASCRFNIPYWPMKESRILMPLAENRTDLGNLRQIAKKARELLETKVFESIDTFLGDIQSDEHKYLDIIRSTINKPTVCFKRDMTEIMTNTFHPWIARTLNSNMDLQIILDEYSCAQYVVDYVNKSNRGMSNLHRELVKLNEANPDMTHEQLLKKLGSRILNTVELSAQEGAWYLLRQDMSYCSRDVVFIPTVWPCERQKSYKTRAQMGDIDPESTDIWTKSIIQRYEERPHELETTCLAEFAAWYTLKSRARSQNQPEDDNVDDGDAGPEPSPFVDRIGNYYRREFCRVICSRSYDSSDVNNFKREMVMLYIPFRNEQVDVIDRNKFLGIYANSMEQIAMKRSQFISGIDIEQIVEEIKQAQAQPIDDPTVDAVVERDIFVRGVLNDGGTENFDDFDHEPVGNSISAVRTRANVSTKEEYCKLMRTTNERQRELILEFIHRITRPDSQPIQLFFTGPAGCGKTYVLKLIMETLNRYSQEQNALNNAYVACASTGKASVGINGTTVHSAFHITQSKRQGPIARESLHNFRQLFANVKGIIIDEVSMIGNDILHKVNQRLQQITGELEDHFGKLNIVFSGDFKQLPPVNATPVYKGSRGHLEGALLWQSLDFFPLTQVMRQNDQAFSTLLTKIGSGSPLTPAESQLIEARFRTQEWCDTNLKDVVRLYHRNNMVDQYNRKAIVGGLENIANDLMIGYSNNDELVAARTKLHRMSTMETAGLPYSLSLACGYPYMLTSNTDIEDGLVNGAIGNLRYIENLADNADQSQPAQFRVWLEFPEPRIGTNARVKFRPSIVSHRGSIRNNWTPISMKTVSINLGRTMRCKRTQLPMTPASAITIHKSQGGTFDQAVIQYEKSQQTQLIYVALSRVKSLDGLYLVNSKNDFTFYHKAGSSAPSIKEIKDEYARLSAHQLETVTQTIRDFLGTFESEDICFIICTINAQSLVAHHLDISSDKLLTRSDLLVITETWVDNNLPVDIEGYELIKSADDQERAITGQRRTAGGVAIYKKVNSRTVLASQAIQFLSEFRDEVGDATSIKLSLNNHQDMIITAIYIHPGSAKNNIKIFLRNALTGYSRNDDNSSQINGDMKLIATGDFNQDIKSDDWIISFVREEFNLEYVISDGPTTLGNTTIDLSFIRGLNASSKPYVSYFSYHRPLFNKIIL